MEEKQQKTPEQEQESPAYTPRPAWQLWAARIGLVVFIILVILQILHIARGFA